jgi:heavy metal sensor kinase
MNARSISFQMTLWYAGLLAGVFALLGCMTYLALQHYLEADFEESRFRLARQIAQFLIPELKQNGRTGLNDEIGARYAPEVNNRYVRIQENDGSVLYRSGPPRDGSFDPGVIERQPWPTQTETSRREPLAEGREMLITSFLLRGPEGERYLIESGAAMDAIQSVLRHLLVMLAVGLPVATAIAAAGGYFLIKRALLPVSRITASAEHITSRSLGERLPVAHTGDELERLSNSLNRMITRLDDAFQYTRRFVADASHELRTPLTVLRGELEALLENKTLTPEMRDTAASSLEEAERLANIVEGLFALSRLDAGEAQRESARFDLGQLAVSTAEQMALLAEDKNISVTCEAGHGATIEGDRSRLKQVIVNLLDNAIKFTSEAGAIKIRVWSAENSGILEVTDNGIGIPTDALPHVFERFFRVDKARSRELGGAGLGLSIVQSIVTAHHGRVTAASFPGQGSCFRVELPLASPETENKQAPA